VLKCLGDKGEGEENGGGDGMALGPMGAGSDRRVARHIVHNKHTKQLRSKSSIALTKREHTCTMRKRMTAPRFRTYMLYMGVREGGGCDFYRVGCRAGALRRRLSGGVGGGWGGGGGGGGSRWE
jgi:hypothetical protein